ncbi:MAG: alanine racemase [Pseudomonadota bacterium]
MPASPTSKTLLSQFTPCAVVDRSKLAHNIARLNTALAPFDVDLRPHVKTTKSPDISRQLIDGHSGAITVSTLAEAEYFFSQGFSDILYAVGIAPGKLPRVAALLERGADLKVILDSAVMADQLADWGDRHRCAVPVLLEVNSDDHRAGIDPGDAELIDAATRLAQSNGADFRGVMTHAGGSYHCTSPEQIAAMAKQERDAIVQCVDELSAAGIPCPIVSVGSTPTALFATNLDGVTEVRAGVYPFFDLVMAGLGCCSVDNVALSVLTTVIGHKPRLNTVITDAGGLALSKDRGTSNQAIDCQYGLVCEAASGQLIDNVVVASVNQEHGLISTRDESPIDFAAFPIGSQLRILPNHSCMTAAAYSEYIVVDGKNPDVTDIWPRCGGWQRIGQDRGFSARKSP